MSAPGLRRTAGHPPPPAFAQGQMQLYHGARPKPIMRPYQAWKCCMPSSIGLW